MERLDFPGGLVQEMQVQIPGLGRSPGEGNDNPLEYSRLGNPLDGGACQVTVHGIAKELDMI